jgi:hypothetical protein
MKTFTLAAITLVIVGSALAQGVRRDDPLRSIRATITADINIPANDCSHTDVPLTGAVVGGECVASLPPGFPDTVTQSCHVDAPDNVDLHICTRSAPYDPASKTYSVRVFIP